MSHVASGARLDDVRGHASHLGRGRAGARVELRDVEDGELVLAHQPQGRLMVFVALSGEAGDDVGGERELGNLRDGKGW